MVSITRSQVQDVYGEREPALSTSKRDSLVSIAETLTDKVFAGRTGRSTIIEGDKEDFAKYVAAHLWELSEGGEQQSTNQTGGSVNYDHLRTDALTTLGETRFGRVALMMIREEASVGVVRTDY